LWVRGQVAEAAEFLISYTTADRRSGSPGSENSGYR
jgi:hypothetical protein